MRWSVGASWIIVVVLRNLYPCDSDKLFLEIIMPSKLKLSGRANTLIDASNYSQTRSADTDISKTNPDRRLTAAPQTGPAFPEFERLPESG